MLSSAWHYFLLSAPLFVIVLIGFMIGAWRCWQPRWTSLASKIVFAVILPAMLFRLMSDLHGVPPVDARLLIAFFGGCFVVFAIGRMVGAWAFRLDGVSQSVFALGGIFSNNVLLGLPIAKMTLGEGAVPAVALVIVFNALTLWTLVSVSVEWARHGSFSIAGFGKMALGVITNPVVAGIVAGTLFGLSGWSLPGPVHWMLDGLADLAAPAALLVLGMGLAEYGIKRDWQLSVAVTTLKLFVQPCAVWIIGLLLGLPPLELQAVVLLASMAVGANVYLMAMQFQVLQGPIASSLVLSTALAALTTPLILAAMHAVTNR
ncbi:MAG TPA: AEC family transporter [Povalibacter sp.]|uniref:AEC family transporter n=1 Tax=Povalibacter sp. TaxID=1962978 RepID=UPI002B84D4D9|nr:AEC family transporter [Povalibacter sp.]HMN44328.1 AEC family transporter [Povalibacter sp.]